MHWKHLRTLPWLDTRARFVAGTRPGGALLDLGSSDGETLRHFAELRPDLKFFAADREGVPEQYPRGCQFARVDFERDPLPWPDASLDAITCMHVIEHLHDLAPLLGQVRRLLRPGARAYFETPHPRSLLCSSPPGRAAGTFTLNFYDDLTHTQPVPVGALAQRARRAGLEVVAGGISRNWLFAAAHPLFCLLPASRAKFTARVHWIGWSAFLILQRPS